MTKSLYPRGQQKQADCSTLCISTDALHTKIASLPLKKMILKYWIEVRSFLPELPVDIEATIDNAHLVTSTGVGGFVAGLGKMLLSFDPNFSDKLLQEHNLRGTIFHQAYHMVQGHSFANPTAEYDTALDNAIYEGAAIVFEQTYANSYPAWGDYRQVSSVVLDQWQAALSKIPIYQHMLGTKLWQEWSSAADDPKDSWRSYRVGTRLIDEYLKKTRKNILDIRHLSAEHIRITL